LDDIYDPATNADTDVDALMASGPSVDCDPDPDWLGVDPNISDTEPDQQPILSEADFSSSEEDFDSDDDSYTNLPHPSLMPPSEEHQSTFTLSSLLERDPDSVNLDQSNTVAATATDLPYVVQRLREQLLSGYTAPNNPPFHDLRGRKLTSDEELSLKHYITWVDSRGTVKAYHLHAQVLQETTGREILSLYMVRKLAIEVTGLSSRLVDMCPRSCMAFTGEYKDLQSCIYIHDRCIGPCGQPCYDKKNQPRAQMLYTPIAPAIQSFYGNREMADNMRYRHKQLQMAMNNSNPDGSPTKCSDFADSINHINHFNELHLFQDETDTAITISGDGAQLTMKKQSDVWVLIVTILNLPPTCALKQLISSYHLLFLGPLHLEMWSHLFMSFMRNLHSLVLVYGLGMHS
jgi:hypothetical protein